MRTQLGPEPLAARARQLLPRPSGVERGFVVAAVLVLFVGTPLTWFVPAGATEVPYFRETVLIQLLLMGVGLVRLAGLPELFLTLFATEPLLSLYTGLIVASILWSSAPELTAPAAVLWAVTFLYAIYLLQRFDLSELLGLIAIAVTIGVAVNLVVVLSAPEVAVDPKGAWTGTFTGNKNALGAFALFAGLQLFVAARVHRRFRAALYAALAADVLLLVRSQSATALIAAVVGTCLLVVFTAFRGRRTLPGAVLVGFVGAGATMLWLTLANLAALASLVGRDVTFTGRTRIWEAVWERLGEALLLGHGFQAAFYGYDSPMADALHQAGFAFGHAHNSVLQTVAELGVIGLALHLAVFLRTTVWSVAVVRWAPTAIGLWPLAFLTLAYLLGIPEQGVTFWVPAWLLYCICVLAVSRARRERSSPETSGNERSEPTIATPTTG
jgi:exopolysaccharide production protein ExoQ